MSVENASAFIERVNEDSELLARMEAKEDPVTVGEELGLQFTSDELAEAATKLSEEMSIDDLKNTSGGFAAYLPGRWPY